MRTQPCAAGRSSFGFIVILAVLFVAGCGTQAGTQFTVTTTSGQLGTVVVNAVYAGATLSAANGTAPYTWAVTSGAVPTGLTLSSAGILSGTATQSGTFNFTVTVTDAQGHTAAANLTLTVDLAPAITSANSTTFTAGTAGTFTATATGFPTPTFTETGAMPSGVTLNATTGVLGGTPAANTGGTYPVTITATNGTGTPATQRFSLTVDQAPAFTSQSNTSFAIGSPGTFTVTAMGFPASTLSETGALPTGVTFNAGTGVLSGTTGTGTQGSYPITLTATNGIGTAAMQSFTLSVDRAPAITSGNSTTFTAGAAGTFTVAGTGFPAPTFTETGALPSGVTLNATTGVLGGTLAANTGGTYAITLTATNGIGTAATQSFTLSVDQAPVFTSQNSTSFAVGAPGTFTVAATGTPTPTLSETGALPTGVSFNTGTGVLSGTPGTGTQRTYPITLTATNGIGTPASQSFTLTVNLAPAITSGNSTTFTAGTAGMFTVTATGFPAPTFSEAGSLPSGVTLNTTTGALSGTPGAGTGGTYPITIAAQNAVNPNATQTFTLTVDQAPAITSANSSAFVVGSPGTFTVVATGTPAPTFSETGALPTGISLSSAGVLSGTPGSGTQGSYPITITASNGIGTPASQSFTLAVNLAPAITSGNSTTFTAGTPGTFTVTATGTPAPTFRETGSLPVGVTLNSTTGALSGTPGAATGGVYPITITASNGIGTPATQGFTLTVDQSPAVTSANNTTFAVGSVSSFTVTASGFPAPTFSETGALPTGISLSSAGVLGGTPGSGTQGSYPVTITASNGIGTSGTQSFTITVSFTAPPSFTSSSSTTFLVGTAGTFSLTATGTPAPTFSETGSLPSGVTLNSTTGVLAGTPAANAAGSYSISVSAHNGIGTDATQGFTLTVDQASAITSANSTTFTEGSPGTFTVTATGFPATTFSETGTLPSGVSLNTTTGALGGTPLASGTYPITIVATNGVGTPANQSFTLTVNLGPAITSGNSTTFTVGSAGTFTVTATGTPAPTFSETGSLPSGVTLNSTTGILAGTPAANTGGSYPITITASNGIGTPATQGFTLTMNQAPVITSQNNTTFGVGTASTFTVTATGNPLTSFSETGALPTGISFSTSGVLSGTPGTGTQGAYPITITAANGVSPNGTQSFTLTVSVNTPASITSQNNTTFSVGAAGTFTVTATGTPAPTFSASGSLPGGVTLDSTTGVLAGTPAANTGGFYTITITASNGIGSPAQQTFNLTVDQAPQFNNSNDGATFFIGSVGTYMVNTQGMPQPTFSETGTLPSGVSLSSAGVVSGTPASGTPGSYPITITASNGIGTPATESFTLTVTPAITCPMTPLGNETSLSGSYVGQLNGFGDANGPFQATAVFAADGSGSITGGEADTGTVLNFSGGSYQNPIAPALQAITGGCYQLGSDDRGLMIWDFGTNGNATFAFSVRGDGALGRFIEFDDVNASLTDTHTRDAGVFLKQTVSSPFSVSNLNGSFAFGLTGYTNDNCTSGTSCGSDGGYQRLASVGRATFDGSGNMSNFVFDVAQINGGAQQNIDSITPVNTTYSAPDSLGRGTFTISGSNATLGGPFSVDFAYYVVDATHFFLQSIDSATNNPLFDGEAIAQTGTFTSSALNGNAFFSMTGTDIMANSYTVIAAGVASGTGTGSNVSVLLDETSDGNTVSVGTTPITGGTFTASSNGMGVLTIGSGGSGEAFSVAMIGTNTGFIMEGTQALPGSSLLAGLMEAQTTPSGGFGNSSASGLFVEANAFPTDPASQVEVGSITLTPGSPTGSLSGASDGSHGLSCQSCLAVNSSISTTYSVDANGRITLFDATESGGSIFGWLRDTSHGVLLDSSSKSLTIQLEH